MAPEGVELPVPVPLLFLEPLLEPDQAFWPEVEDTQARIVGAPFVGDHSSPQQDPQVPAHGGWRESGRVGELAGAHRFTAQELHHATTAGVG